MTERIRVLDTGLRPARWNVAMTSALIERHACGQTPDTIRFHRYPACVLIGRGQDLTRVADVSYCQKHGIEIARRVTGGGAVYMNPGTLAWELFLGCRGLGADWEDATRTLCGIIASGLSRFGITAQFRAPNDIEIGGLKISGSAGYTEGRSAVLQGTMLIEDDAPTMAAALRFDESKVRRRVTCLTAAMGRTPSIAEVKGAILDAFSRSLQRTPVDGEPDEADLTVAEKLLRDEIGSDEFVMGSHAFGAQGAAT